MDLPHPDPLNETLDDSVERTHPDLPRSLTEHVMEGRIGIALAEALHEELLYSTAAIAARRDTDRRSNLLYLDNGETLIDKSRSSNGWHGKSGDELHRLIIESIRAMPYLDAEHAAFQGGTAEIGGFLMKLATAAKARFTMQSHSMLRGKNDIAFDFGYVDQFADWDSPEELDTLVRHATDQAKLREEFPGVPISVTPHDRDHPKVNYEFWRTSSRVGNRIGIVVVRKRPYADISIEIDGEPVSIEVFRKSWFLVSTSARENRELFNQINAAQHGRSTSDANGAIAHYVKDTLKSPDLTLTQEQRDEAKRQQTFVLPCTMTYVAQIRDPRHIEPDVELEA
nr:hypothetical protein [uncultured bacterium]AIA14773.1 hypothetical protein [uncultured bacterium]